MKNISDLVVLAVLFVFVQSCQIDANSELKDASLIKKNEEQFTSRMQEHLDAVTNRDLETLRSTMCPDGKMQLILQSSEIIEKVEGFMDYHEEWFQDTTWTFTTKILNTEVGESMGMAVTEVVYGEPDRNGEPYWNRMVVSYDLQKQGDQWYIIKDHASSVEKSTDKMKE